MNTCSTSADSAQNMDKESYSEQTLSEDTAAPNCSRTVYINGGTGFVGRALCSALLKRSPNVCLYVQTRRPGHHIHPDIKFLHSYNDLPEGISPKVVVNLAGAPIADKRWSTARRKELVNSRVRATSELRNAILQRGTVPSVLVNASAIGYYGDRGDETVTESSSQGVGFASTLCKAWEDEALQFEAFGARVALLRMGVVLGQGGGMLEKILPLYRMGLGGPIGRGTQWMSWIHLDDLTNLILTVIDNEKYTGVVNATAPEPVTQKEFSRVLATRLNRPSCIPTPSLALSLLLGDMARELLLGGQKVLPEVSKGLGFEFKYPNLTEAIDHLMS